MNVYVGIQKLIENQLKVSVTTPQSKRFLKKPVFQKLRSESCFYNSEPNQMFVGESKTADRIKSELN